MELYMDQVKKKIHQTLDVAFTGLNRVYRLEIQSVMLVFSTPLVK
jgi:hypothetical protein